MKPIITLAVVAICLLAPQAVVALILGVASVFAAIVTPIITAPLSS